jgi:CubicO group peptidase (beta-lactamase class C family)
MGATSAWVSRHLANIGLGFDCFPTAGRLNVPTTNFSRDGGFLVRCLLPRIRGSLGIASHGATGRATAALVLLAAASHGAFAAPDDNAAMEQKALSVVPAVEDYIAANMKAFDVPGLAIGIVVGDKVVYAKGFGVRKKRGEPVDTRTVFQIGSTSKAFLATTMAIAVDHGKLRWDDRVVDLDPGFQLKDPWVSQEFRVFDLLAQRSSLPAYANDIFAFLGFDASAMIRSLRFVNPVSSFRTTFAYTNITHLVASRVVARAEGAKQWTEVLQKEIFDPLGMKDSTDMAAGIEAAPNHAEGYRYDPAGSVEAPFTPIFPYALEGAGAINSNVEDMVHWLRLQIGNGTFDGNKIVSPENLAATRIPKVGISDHVAYALGWLIQQTPNGTIFWHNGGTAAFGAMVAFQPDRKVGVVILSNETLVGMPDSVGLWVLDRIMDNPIVDYAATSLAHAQAEAANAVKIFERPANGQPSPPLAPLYGNFANPGLGKAVVRADSDASVIELTATGAKLRLDGWDGSIFTASLVREGKFSDIAANLGPLPMGFAQFLVDKEGRQDVIRLTLLPPGQVYELRREPR